MNAKVKGWLIAALLLGTAVYAIAEEVTLSTYYPSPRGVYKELRVGSGNVASPTAKLQVTLPTAETGLALRVDDEDGDTTPFLIDATGQVGIGMVVPRSALHLHRTVQPRLQLTNDTTTAGSARGGIVALQTGTPGNPQTDVALANLETGGSISLYAQASSGFIKFITNGFNVERMRIDSAGNVGIGTTTPTTPAPGPGGTPTTGNLDVNDVFLRGATPPRWASQGGALGDSIMYLSAGAGSSAPCPAGWTEADEKLSFDGPAGNYVRTCFRTDLACQVMYLNAATGLGPFYGPPALCPAGWIQADYRHVNAAESLPGADSRTCYICP